MHYKISAGGCAFSSEYMRVLLCPLLFTAASATLAPCAPVQLQLQSVQKIWDAAPHNAFPDMVRFQDQWYVAFREADDHMVYGDGNLRVIRSADGLTWESAAEFDRAGEDMRDARLTVLNDGRLMLNSASAPLDSDYSRQSLCWFSANGDDWSDAYEVGEEDWWLWSVSQHPGGDLYGIAYGQLGENPTAHTTTRLYKSSDGISYQTLVPTLTAQNDTNEADIIFRQDGTAVTLVRCDGAYQSYVGTSAGDYTDWSFKTINRYIGGPEIIELPDGNILAATRLTDGYVRTAISWLDPATGEMEELLSLPSGGDTSYPGLAWHDNRLWVAYYSSHEGKSNIYFAEVAVSEAPITSPALVCRHQNDANPADEGWSLGGYGIGITEGPVAADPVGGLPAWNINDASTTGGSLRYYSVTPTSEQMKRAAAEGWVMSARLRLIDAPDDIDASVYFEYAGNSGGLDRRFVVVFGANEAGDPCLSLYEGQSICLEGLGGGYHLYELKYDPATATADLFCDGVEYLSDYAGMENVGLARVIWGANESISTGSGNYNMVYFRNCLADPVAGDANCDGKVDAGDAEVLAKNWLAAGGVVWEMGDFNGDQIVDDKDAALLAANWQDAGSASVPEAGSLVLIISALGMFLVRRYQAMPA